MASTQPSPAPQPSAEDYSTALLGKCAALHPIFNPKTVAVIGDSERPGSTGHKALASMSCFGKPLFAVGGKEPQVMGVPAFAGITAVPQAVDLALIAAPVEAVPGIIGECVQAGVRGAVVMSSIPGEYAEFEKQIKDRLRGSRMRVIGPSSLGVINPHIGLNATPDLATPLGGSVAFLTQSGAIGTAVLDWSLQQVLGLSAFVSTGAMLDVGWGDLIDYFGSDTNTHSILLYMESIAEMRPFLSAAREVALNKPIIVTIGGRSDAAARAGGGRRSAGDEAVLDAAFRRVGVCRVDTLGDLFNTADALSKQPRPHGPRLAIVSNAIGPGRLAADSVIASGGTLAELSAETQEQLSKIHAMSGAGDRPDDFLGDGSAESYLKAVSLAAQDANCDGLLLVMVPLAFSDPRKAAELLVTFRSEKPVLACFMGGESAAAQQIVTRACIPTLPSAHTAVRAFNNMWRYSYNLRGIYQTPALRSDVTDLTLKQLAESILHAARDAGCTALNEIEAKRLLAAYHIPSLESRVARSEDEAVRIACEIGGSVLMKFSGDGAQPMPGAEKVVNDAEALRRAWRQFAASANGGQGRGLTATLQPVVKLDGFEVRIGSRTDPQFGPVLLFGAGGKMAQVVDDVAVGLPPLNATLARRMMEQTRIYNALCGANARQAVDLEALLVHFSRLVVELPWIKEIDINPLLASPQMFVALDARVLLHGPEVSREQLPKPAIRPYPSQYVWPWTMKDGETITIRPIRAEDEPLMIKFHQGLSDRSVYLRFFQGVKLDQRTTHDRLTRICFIDYDREMALVAERRDPQTEERQIIAVGNLTRVHGRNDAEIAAITSDNYQGRGLGSEMMRRLIRVAREEKFERVLATTMLENRTMSAMLKKLGFNLSFNMDDHLVDGVLELQQVVISEL